MNIKLLTEHHLEFLSLKGGCTGSSESTHVKMPHCWKSHVAAQMSTSISFLLISVKLPMDAGFLIFSKIMIDCIFNFIYHSFLYILGFGRRERRTR